jgi:glutathione S-transferase
MQILYHYPLCPLSRQVRLILKELNVTFSLVKEEYWLRGAQFLKFNPAGELPVFVEPFDVVVAGIYPIIEFINSKYPDNEFISHDLQVAAEIRRLLSWYNNKFYSEVTKVLIDERLIRLLKNAGAPRTDFLRIAKTNFTSHMNYLNNLLQDRSWIAYDKLSFADFAAASHLSVVDYFGEIIWEQYPRIKEWYSIIKSRPGFRPFLQDTIAGFAPPKHYQDLDF